MSLRTPTLAEVVRGAIDARLEQLHTSMPARVTTYDPDTCRCSAQPLVKVPVLRADGETEWLALPQVVEVPVAFPGAGAWRLTFPVEPGDFVWLVFAECPVGEWLEAGGGPVRPVEDRRHHLSDCVALPGVLPRPDARPASGSAMVLEATLIHAGGTAQLATKADLDALASYVASHLHSDPQGGFTGPPSTSPPSAAGTQVLKGA